MRAVSEALIAHGADTCWAVAVTGRGEYTRVDGVPRARRLEPAELLKALAGSVRGNQ